MKTTMIFILLVFAYSFGGRWVIGDTHNHTGSSSDVGPGSTAASSFNDAVNNCGMNYIVITDHNNFDEYFNGNILDANNAYGDKDHICLIGTEYSNNGHWTVFGIKPEDRDILNVDGSSKVARWQAAIRNVNQAGGWISANHPQRNDAIASYSEFKQLAQAGMQGFEILNSGDIERALDIYPVGGWWDQVLTEGYRMVPIAATDNHGGNHYGGYARTHVYIDSDSITEQSILDGFKNGRVWAVGQRYSYGAIRTGCFDMEMKVGNVIMGGTVQAVGDSVEVHVRAVLNSCALDIIPRLSSIKLISDGQAVWGIAPNRPVFDSTITIPAVDRKYVRLEVLAANTKSSGSMLRAFSGPIYFTPGTTGLTLSLAIPSGNSLIQVAPNPFVATTTISSAGLHISIYDIHGRKIDQIHNRRAGKTIWNTANHPAGIYIAKTTIKGKTFSKRLYFIK
jgi:hypothetical protein